MIGLKDGPDKALYHYLDSVVKVKDSDWSKKGATYSYHRM